VLASSTLKKLQGIGIDVIDDQPDYSNVFMMRRLFKQAPGKFQDFKEFQKRQEREESKKRQVKKTKVSKKEQKATEVEVVANV
jgi:tRNA U38,U39,U40 pseudouridine synthase TruA